MVVPFMDASAKYLGGLAVPVLMIVWGRFFASLIILLGVLVATGKVRRLPTIGSPGLQIARALLSVGATMGYFAAIQTMPLADALAVYFIYPFLITALSPLVLGERPGLHRWGAVCIGFLGSLLVIQPAADEGIAVGVYYLIAASFAFALYNLLTRRLSGRADPMGTLLVQMVVGTVVMSAALPYAWQTPNLVEIGLFTAIGFASVAAHFLLVRSYDFAPASVLAPFTYVEMIGTTLLGYLIFNDFPDALTWLGVAVIIASGTYIAHRERRLENANTHP